ncbi:MAG: cytochrome c3 family protein, partial [bacterium]
MRLNRLFILVEFIAFILIVVAPTFLWGQNFPHAPPHWENGIDCGSCHVVHQKDQVQLNRFEGNANLCMSCHNPLGVAGRLPFADADRAVPGVSGTSHAWDVPADNPARGAQTPQDAEMAKIIFNGYIVCSTCHNQHSQEFPPFLRASNFQDAICKDCHAVRDVGSFRDSPENKGSHPVGVTYPTSDARFFEAPQNQSLPLIDSGRVECTTCHSPHNADSGGANDGEGDGNILRAANDAALCKSCHTYDDHLGQDCLSCHQPHDPNRTNIFLIKGSVATPNSGERSVAFLAESGANSFADGDASLDGICEVCHTATNHHQNDGSAPGGQSHNDGVNCTQCHRHADAFLPSGGAQVPAPHNLFDCAVCHVTPD